MPPDVQTASLPARPVPAAPPSRPEASSADLSRLREDLATLPTTGTREAAGTELLARMRAGLRGGRERIRERFEAGEAGAETVHRDLTRQMDLLIQGALDFAERRLYGTPNPSTGEHLAVVAVGGYGRGELAPGSDVDLLFLCPYKRTPLIEQLAEFLLYKLWDLGLKVGQAVRSVQECVKLAKGDLSVRTALLESRLVWGSEHLYQELVRAYEKEVVAGNGPDFVEAKLAERDQRHQRLGDSRFLLEPNVKEGKGGLRDLHTLLWIGKFLYRIREPGELVHHGVLDRPALVTLLRARRVLWTVRCHLHYLTGRAEERLTFDVQPEIARRTGYRDRQQGRAVERFMKRYYIAARDVGALTRIVCAALEDKHQRRPRLALPRLGLGRRRINGFTIQHDRVGVEDAGLFEREPAKMLELFHLAQERELDIHPQAIAAVAETLRREGSRRLRDDPEASRLFLDVLCSRKDPALTLGRMSEAGLLGKFLPDFGRVVGQTQHNLYHVYTVDEHTIRAVDILHRIERGRLAADLPLATEVLPKILSRRELYLAVFLHDLGKARRGDHSVVGAAITQRLCRHLGLPEDATETVAWLVRHHLVMSNVAFRRDLEDPQTIADFVALVQSPERLKLLLMLTVCDIRAVGPGVWNGWKGQLLRELYQEAASAMAAGGDPQGRRAARIDGAKRRLAEALTGPPGASTAAWPAEAAEAYVARHDPRYWLGFTTAEQARHAAVVRAADAERAPLAVDFRVDEFRARTELLLYAADHPGLFMKVAGALALSGVSIVDAHIFTTVEGMALDVLGFQDATHRTAVAEPGRLDRIRGNIEKALRGELWLEKALAGRRSTALPARADVFQVEPRVLVDNTASRTHSVLEVNGRDRPGLLFDVAKALKDLGLVIHSAHVATYGERVVDVFYVKDVFGLKLTQRSKLQRVHRQLSEALAAG